MHFYALQISHTFKIKINNSYSAKYLKKGFSHHKPIWLILVSAILHVRTIRHLKLILYIMFINSSQNVKLGLGKWRWWGWGENDQNMLCKELLKRGAASVSRETQPDLPLLAGHHQKACFLQAASTSRDTQPSKPHALTGHH